MLCFLLELLSRARVRVCVAAILSNAFDSPLSGLSSEQDAIRAGEAISTKDCTVRIKLLAPPLYVLTTQTISRKEGIEMLSQAIDAVKSSIESNKGKLVVREGARAVSERDEKLLKEQMARLEGQNRDVADDEDDYEEGMGDIDVENATPALQI